MTKTKLIIIDNAYNKLDNLHTFSWYTYYTNENYIQFDIVQYSSVVGNVNDCCGL